MLIDHRSRNRLAVVVASTYVGAFAFACTKAPAVAPTAPDGGGVEVVTLAEPDVIVAQAPVTNPAADPDAQPAVQPSLLEQESIPVGPDDDTDYAALGATLLTDKRPLEATGALRRALADGARPDVWKHLGDAYLGSGDVDRAIPCFEEAVALDVDMVTARKSLARLYVGKGDATRARHHAEEVVRRVPGDTTARYLLGRAFMQASMWREAVDAFDLVAQAQPDNIFAHNNLGYSALMIGDNETALLHLEQIVALSPQKPYMFNNLGVAYERTGRADFAHAAFARAAELSPRYAAALLNRDRLQNGLSQQERIVSADTLLKLRELPETFVDAGGDSAGDDGGSDSVLDVVPASDDVVLEAAGSVSAP